MTNRIWTRLWNAWLAVTMLFLVSGTSAQAELLIRVTEGADTAIPVSVVPFAESGQLPPGDKFGAIVRNDLAMSGEFRPLEPEKMLSLPRNGRRFFTGTGVCWGSVMCWLVN